jgi:hypothetical protein
MLHTSFTGVAMFNDLVGQVLRRPAPLRLELVVMVGSRGLALLGVGEQQLDHVPTKAVLAQQRRCGPSRAVGAELFDAEVEPLEEVVQPAVDKWQRGPLRGREAALFVGRFSFTCTPGDGPKRTTDAAERLALGRLANTPPQTAVVVMPIEPVP